MRFEKYITEKRKNNVIDVQPMYESAIHFDMEDFTDFLKNQHGILGRILWVLIPKMISYAGC